MPAPMFKDDPELRESVRRELLAIQREHGDNPTAVMATYKALMRLQGIDIPAESTPIEPVKPRMNWLTRFWQWVIGDE